MRIKKCWILSLFFIILSVTTPSGARKRRRGDRENKAIKRREAVKPLNWIRTVFTDYDKQELPNSEHPTRIQIGVTIVHLNFQQNNGIMETQLLLRQQWVDPRLRLEGRSQRSVHGFGNSGASKSPKLHLTGPYADAVWWPDIFISNTKSVSSPDVLSQQRTVVLHPNGRLWHVRKLTVQSWCPSIFSLSTLNRFNCTLRFETHTHTSDEIRLEWLQIPAIMNLGKRGVYTNPNIKFSNWDRKDCTHSSTIGSFPCLEIVISFRNIATKENHLKPINVSNNKQ